MRVRERFRGRSRSRFTASSDQAMMPAKRAVEEEAFSHDSFSAREASNDAREKKKKDTRKTETDDEGFLVRGGVGTVRARRMVDSSAIAHDGKRLRERLRRDGYAMLRGFLNARDVDEARKVALAALAESRPDAFVDPKHPTNGLLRPNARSLGLLARQDVAARPEMQRVTECDALFRVAERVLFSDDDDDDDAFPDASSSARGGARRGRSGAKKRKRPRRAMTSAYKWLRAVAAGEFTGVHTDRVFLGGGDARLVTAWIPLGDVRMADGALMVAAGSHADETFAGVRRTYGASAAGEDGAQSGWLTDDASTVLAVAKRAKARRLADSEKDADARTEEDAQYEEDVIDWRTCDFRSGDVVLLALDVTHMSLANVSGESGEFGSRVCRARVSVDTRWQPEGDDPDPRVRLWRRQREGAVETVVLS